MAGNIAKYINMRCIRIPAALLLFLSMAVGIFPTASLAASGSGSADAASEDVKVDSSIPAVKNPTLQEANVGGKNYHTVRWDNPDGISSYDSANIKVEICAEVTFSYNDPRPTDPVMAKQLGLPVGDGKRQKITTDKIVVGSCAYSDNDEGYTTCLDDDLAGYLNSLGDAELIKKFGNLSAYVDAGATTASEAANFLKNAVTLNGAGGIGDGISKLVNTAWAGIGLVSGTGYDADFQYDSIRYFLRYVVDKKSTVCERGEDGKYHASVTFYNVSNNFGGLVLGANYGDKRSFDFVSDYPIVLLISADPVKCDGGPFTMDSKTYFEGSFCFFVVQYNATYGYCYSEIGASGSLYVQSKLPIFCPVPTNLYSVNNCGIYRTDTANLNPATSSELTSIILSAAEGNPDPDVFASYEHAASAWTAVTANYTPKKDGSQSLGSNHTVTSYDSDGNVVSIDTSGIESWLEKINKRLGWLEKIYNKIEECRKLLLVDTVIDLTDTVLNVLFCELQNAVSSLGDSFQGKFPFSLYQNIVLISTALACPPKAPEFDIVVKYDPLNINMSCRLDFSIFNRIHDICTFFFAGLCLLSLMPLTRHTLDIMDRLVKRR